MFSQRKLRRAGVGHRGHVVNFDPLVDFEGVHTSISRGVNTDANRSTLVFNQRDQDAVVDHDGCSRTAGKIQH